MTPTSNKDMKGEHAIDRDMLATWREEYFDAAEDNPNLDYWQFFSDKINVVFTEKTSAFAVATLQEVMSEVDRRIAELGDRDEDTIVANLARKEELEQVQNILQHKINTIKG
jgi:hypothetical protein